MSRDDEHHVGLRPLPTWLIFLLYALLTFVMTWPVIGQLGTHIPGRIGDAYAHLWTFNWIKQALLSGQNPYQTDLLFYPHGASLINHNIAWLHIALWLPLQALIGGAAAYSLVYLIAFPFNGLAAYLLARELTDSWLAAFVGGLVFAFWPYNLSHHGHPNLVLLGWIPLSILYLRRTLRHGRWQDGLGAAVCLALIGITRWQLLIIGGFLIALYLLYEFITNSQARSLSGLRQLVVISALSLLFMAPLLAPILSYQLRRDNPDDLLVAEEEPYSTDLLAYFVPNSYQPWWGDEALQLGGRFIGNPIYTRSIGYITLILAVLGIATQWRRSWFWLLAALFYVLLTLGPQLSINGVPSLSLPYRWIENAFVIQLVRFPDRFNAVMGIPVAMLAAFGIVTLSQGRSNWANKFAATTPKPTCAGWSLVGEGRLGSRSGFNRQSLSRSKFLTSNKQPGSSIYRRSLPFLLTLLILVEYASRFATLPLATPVWYQTLADAPNPGGILDIPMETQGRFDKTYMLYQLTHGQPLVEGHVSRPSREMFAFINSVPFLDRSRGRHNPPAALVNVSDQFRLLAEANIPYLILHKQFLRPEQEARWRQWLIIQPYYEDDELIVYRTEPPQAGRDYVASAVMTANNSISLIKATITPDSIAQAEPIDIHTQWHSTAAIAQDYTVCILFTESDPICQLLSPTWPTSHWGANALIQTTLTMPTSPFLPLGTNNVRLALKAAEEPLAEAVTIGRLTINALPRTFAPPQPDHPLQLTWSNGISLVGYDLNQNQTLTLYWQTQQRLPASYKIFIHLVDSRGALAAQIDYIPKNWTYPTHWWEAGEYIHDEVALPVNDLAPGTYQLWLGLYDPATNERLGLETAGTTLPTTDNAIHLLSLDH